MKIGLVDKTASLHSVAWVLQRHGMEVLYHTQDPTEQKIGEGLVPRAKRFEDIADFQPDAVFVYNLPREASLLRKKGLKVMGPTHMSMLIEDDRMYAIRIAKQYGVGVVPETRRFTEVEDAAKFARNEGGRKRWVFKAEGCSCDTNTTHVTADQDHLMSVLEFEGKLNRAKSFVLQEHIEGVEISVEGWFDYRQEKGKEWVTSINSTLERKHLFAGDVGPMTGCMGSVVWEWPQERPKLFRQTLENLTPWLRSAEYIGPVDGNFIVDYKTHRPHFLEFTPRFGWDALEALWALKGPTFMVDITRGEAPQVQSLVVDGFGVAVRLYTPIMVDAPILVDLDNNYNLIPKDVYKDDDGCVRVVGVEGIPSFCIIFEATGQGPTIQRAVANVYEDAIPQVIAPDLTYRNDIGEKAVLDVELLEQWGYIVHRDKRHRSHPFATTISAGG